MNRATLILLKIAAHFGAILFLLYILLMVTWFSETDMMASNGNSSAIVVLGLMSASLMSLLTNTFALVVTRNSPNDHRHFRLCLPCYGGVFLFSLLISMGFSPGLSGSPFLILLMMSVPIALGGAAGMIVFVSIVHFITKSFNRPADAVD